MNAPVFIDKSQIDWAGSVHWQADMPYRALVPVKLNSPNGPMLFQVAGSAQNACGADKALREAVKLHGGTCFYCATKVGPNIAAPEWTLDHVEASSLGGGNDIGNLVVACKPCNAKKGHQPIDSFNPMAAKKWLEALQQQVNDRLKRL
jgi:hypothetical protein